MIINYKSKQISFNVYREAQYTDAAVIPANDTFNGQQGYLDAAPDGIDARWAWTQPNGCGAGIAVIDVERGWTLAHEDFNKKNHKVTAMYTMFKRKISLLKQQLELRNWAWSVRRILALACLLALTGCEYYQVDTQADLPDANPGDGICAHFVAPGTITIGGGVCSLRAAITEANASGWRDSIGIPPGHYTLSLPVASGGGILTISESVNILGSGAEDTILDGNDSQLVFFIENEGAMINNLTVQNGRSGQDGGGIRADSGVSEFHNLIIRDNFAMNGGGGLYVRGDAEVRMWRSTISDNQVQGHFGGGILNTAELWVYESTISNNQSNRAGAIHNQGNLNLRSTTISGNAAVSPTIGTGGLANLNFAVLNNVTLTNNSTNSSSFDSGFRGGGLYSTDDATTVVKNSIIAENMAGGGFAPQDCAGPLTSDSRHNLIGSSSGCGLPANTSTYLLDIDPELSPLTNNGGPTETHNLEWNSPALEAAYEFPMPAADGCERYDQRGVPRPQGNGRCDMGAFERTSSNARITSFTLVDADTDTDVRTLLNGDELYLSDLPSQLNIRANTFSVVESVVFDFENGTVVQTENNAPYALAGDSPIGDYNAFPFEQGDFVLRATPFAGADGSGAAGVSLFLKFSVR